MFAFTICVVPNSIVLANNNVHQLVEDAPLSEVRMEMVPFGAKAPDSAASSHNLSVSKYNYQAQSIGYQLFTDKWLTGKSSMKVNVYNWTVLENHGGTSNKLTIKLFNSSRKMIASKTIRISDSGAVLFSGISSSSKYYVCFEVPMNSNRYTFNGDIR